VEELEKNRFAIGSLLGKLLFLDDDVRAGARLPDGTLKMISEAKEVTGETKYKPAFNFVVRTVPMLLCNNVPSLADVSHAVGPMIRAHWAIENSLHWVMDMVFRDDECRVRTDNAPANFATCRHIAYNLTRKAPGKDSIRLRRKTAGWDDEYLASLIAP
jgi:hypothetical protein